MSNISPIFSLEGHEPSSSPSFPIGGKAAGLMALLAVGADVPAAFVIGHADRELDRPAICAAYMALGGGKVAVRSSAIAEDGIEASFAGQFETFLNVEGEGAVIDAAAQCVAGASRARVAAYRPKVPEAEAAFDGMAIVVQRMVDAAFAGVAFTADPVTQRRDRIVVDVVAGLGDALVSGEARSDHYVLDATCEIVVRDMAPTPAGLDESTVQQIARDAAGYAAQLGYCVDFEWAVDSEGKIWWLQARPITALAADPFELDVLPENPKDVLTRQNIGEIVPGAVTPLSISTTARGIDWATQSMIVASGTRKRIDDRFRVVAVIGNHLFINLSALAEIAGSVLGSHTDQIGFSICGRLVPELEQVAVRSLGVRLWNATKYFRYIGGATKRIKAFAPRVKAFTIDTSADAESIYSAISEALPFLYESYAVHIQSSAGSGAATGALHQIFAKGGEPSAADYARIARLFSALGEVEGTTLINDLRDVAESILARPDYATRFVDADPADAYRWLTSDESGIAREIFGTFLVNHGHRAFRELEMSERGWRDDPAPLVASLRASVKAGPRIEREQSEAHADAAEPLYVRVLISSARKAVQRREQSKEMLVRVTDVFKQAFRAIGGHLAEEGTIEAPDDVFFFTYAELGEAVRGGLENAATVAKDRRRVYPAQERYVFPEVFSGHPDPVPVVTGTKRQITGNPVCVGIAEGFARVARTPMEAGALEAGEILIAPVTDIGWTPYFCLIAGLATDVGSSVSHGAVIAREYGLPAIVNTGNGTSVIRTGDRIRLDAYTGIIDILESADGR